MPSHGHTDILSGSPDLLQLNQPHQSTSGNEYDEINQLLNEISSTMGHSMAEIQSINKRMRSISFNSKIEAARAGAAGRAFSVVSGEMIKLSDQTAEIAARLQHESESCIRKLKSIATNIAISARGTRLIDLAFANIDLLDRNLYERSCDVRWWATDSSLVDALGTPNENNLAFASERLGIILNSYTEYFDLVLCNKQGEIVANGRPDEYRSRGRQQDSASWFRQALHSTDGDDYGFQTVHASAMVKGQRVLVYSASVREGGKTNGKVLGVLGILFKYDNLAQTIMLNTPIGQDMKKRSRVCITDHKGLVLADSQGKILQETLDFPNREAVYRQAKCFMIMDFNGQPHCVAHARAPGYETYTTGWHSLIFQTLE